MAVDGTSPLSAAVCRCPPLSAAVDRLVYRHLPLSTAIYRHLPPSLPVWELHKAGYMEADYKTKISEKEKFPRAVGRLLVTRYLPSGGAWYMPYVVGVSPRMSVPRPPAQTKTAIRLSSIFYSVSKAKHGTLLNGPRCATDYATDYGPL